MWFLRKENFNTRRQHQFGMVELHGRCKLRTYGNSQQFLPHFEEIIKEKGHFINHNLINNNIKNVRFLFHNRFFGPFSKL